MFIHLPINTVKESNGCLLFTAFEIDSSTICRCIGLRNKNNQLILENDTAEIFGKNGLFIIQWADTEAKWEFYNFEEDYIANFDNFWSNELEVVGNKFDNH